MYPLLIFCGLCFSSQTALFLSFSLNPSSHSFCGNSKIIYQTPWEWGPLYLMSHGQFNTTCPRQDLQFLLSPNLLLFYIPYLTKCQRHLLRRPCQKPQSPLTTLSLIPSCLISAQVLIILTSRLSSLPYSCCYSFHLVTPNSFLLAKITHCFSISKPVLSWKHPHGSWMICTIMSFRCLRSFIASMLLLE